MGGQTVLVIGNNFRDQIEKFQHVQYAPYLSRHIISANILNKTRKKYDDSPLAQKESFLAWVSRDPFCSVLADGEEPDFSKANKHGWIRLNSDGQVCEIIDRIIPNSFLDYFVCTVDTWKLKPGAQGISFYETHESTIVRDVAGSALKGAIDLDGMSKIIGMLAAERWDCAAVASRSQTWKSFKIILKKYMTETPSHESYKAALKEWGDQPAVTAIQQQRALGRFQSNSSSFFDGYKAKMFWDECTPEGIDLLRLPRKSYIEKFDILSVLAGEVIKDGVLLKKPNGTELFANLSDETLLTYVFVES